MNINRRTALVLIAAPIVTGCDAVIAPTSPTTISSNLISPLDGIVNPINGSPAKLVYWGYIKAEKQTLLDALREAQLNPQPRRSGYGIGTLELPRITAPYGWVFCIQNQFFGSDASMVTLNKDNLWAAYEKQSLG